MEKLKVFLMNCSVVFERKTPNVGILKENQLVAMNH